MPTFSGVYCLRKICPKNILQGKNNINIPVSAIDIKKKTH